MGNYKKWLAKACVVMMLGTSCPITKVTYAEEPAASSIVINEICAKNTTIPASDGNYYDWIELYNSSEEAVDLSGYGLSDNLNKPYKFSFEEGTVIESGQHLIVYCNSDEVVLDNSFVASFGLSTDGETVQLTDASGNCVDSVTYSAISADVSYARISDGDSTFAYKKMSPGEANETKEIVKADIPAPVLSKEGGFYDETFELSITAQEGCTIRYTLDGSEPTADSMEYTEPLLIEEAQSQILCDAGFLS